MRSIDDVGRVCIPKNLREIYNLTGNTDLQITDNGNGILLSPAQKNYIISNENMKTLRKVYLMLKDSGFLDDEYKEKLSKITKETNVKCETCGENMFLTNDNVYECYKCE